MLRSSTLRILAGLLLTYGIFIIPAYWGPSWLEGASSYLVLVPFLSIFFFHSLGVPGLLENRGLCGWGMCSPTPFGWLFAAGVWTGIAWLIAWAMSRLIANSRGSDSSMQTTPWR